MNMVMLQKLQTIRLFEGIEGPDIPHMLECIGGAERSYAKGEFIFMEGDELQRIGVVISGTVQMIKEDAWGDKMILEMLSTGDIFGESFVCNDQSTSTVSFLATSNCHILFLPFRRLLTVCNMACKFHQRLIENMVVMIAIKNVQMMNKMEILSKKTMRDRILLWLSQQTQGKETAQFTSSLGRVELAEYLCVDRSALTRELNHMKQDGLLDYDRNTFELKFKK